MSEIIKRFEMSNDFGLSTIAMRERPKGSYVHVDDLLSGHVLEHEGKQYKLAPVALLDALDDWSADRVPDDHGEAELIKEMWRRDGDRLEPCPECDGECGEPCAPTTAASAIACIDEHMKQLDKRRGIKSFE